MKILFSSQNVVHYDGQHYYSNPIKATCKRYKALGDEITIFSYMRHVENPKSDIVDDGEVRFVTAKKINSLGAMLRREDKENDHKAEELVKESDMCIAHVPCPHSYMVIKYAKKYGKPYMTVVCGCPWDAYWNFDWRGKFLAPSAYFTLKRVMQESPYSIYVTNEFLQKRYPTKGKSIGCSNVDVSTGVEGVLEKRLSNIEKRKSEGRILRIGTAAAISVPYKGQEFVIKAIAELKKKGLYFEYHLIGFGSEERLRKIAVEAGVEDQVFFRGPLPHSDVLGFMDDMDIYVQPSKQEGLPRATIEAMSRGCLCLGSRVAGIPELLEDAYLFNKGDVKQISEILRSVDETKLKEQAERNYNEAKQYDKNLLNRRRTEFIEEFKRNIKS